MNFWKFANVFKFFGFMSWSILRWLLSISALLCAYIWTSRWDKSSNKFISGNQKHDLQYFMRIRARLVRYPTEENPNVEQWLLDSPIRLLKTEWHQTKYRLISKIIAGNSLFWLTISRTNENLCNLQQEIVSLHCISTVAIRLQNVCIPLDPLALRCLAWGRITLHLKTRRVSLHESWGWKAPRKGRSQ